MEAFSASLALFEGFAKARDAELWCYLWSAQEQTVEQTMETSVILDAIALIMTSM